MRELPIAFACFITSDDIPRSEDAPGPGDAHLETTQSQSVWCQRQTLVKATIGVVIGLVAGAVALAPHARADVFDMCPDGQEGVVGGHTTCAFAENVRAAFYASGMSHSFPAYSPVTGERYEMECEGVYPAHFSNGAVVTSTRCYTEGSDAEVVIW